MVSITVSILFIVFGFILMKYPPKSINSMYGYRTPFSMKNQDTWDISQKHSGFLMIILGIINGIVGILSIVQPMQTNNEKIQLLFSLIVAVAMIILEEVHLRKIFNKDGSKKV